eukprot:CAMPEP_0115631314 /NCGR_PEP_ID=MMETSP0272-20121206/30934_1 /TAXON_ID=71861 /ORGANISM="Scrippsiella trochoidea, Strain CCMP3099" /LENGTH=850 /DNA_ID=CAMNT_0003067973 /DNA_START=38 /DNA_END=2587 /DNA_ORIENTATION=-
MASVMELPVFWHKWVQSSSPLARGRAAQHLFSLASALNDFELATSLHSALLQASSQHGNVLEPARGCEPAPEPVGKPAVEPLESSCTERLVRAAQTAMVAVDAAIANAEANVGDQLDGARAAFHWITTTQNKYDVDIGNAMDCFAASALASIDSLARHNGHSVIKAALKHAQDVLMLACARFADEKALKAKGIAPELKERLDEALRQGGATLDQDLWSRLGNSKYHLFTTGVQWGQRRRRASRHRKDGTGIQEHMNEDHQGIDDAGRVAAPDENPAPKPASGPEQVTAVVGCRSPPILEARPVREEHGTGEVQVGMERMDDIQEDQHELLARFIPKVHNTFLNFYAIEPDDRSEVSYCDSHKAVSCHANWKHDRCRDRGLLSGSTSALEPRKEVQEVLEEIERESGKLPLEVDDCAHKVMNELLDGLPDVRATSLVKQWAELFRRAPKCLFGRRSTFQEMLNVARNVVWANQDGLLDAMELCPESLVIQDVCIAKLARKVCWVSETVLGLRMVQGDAGALEPANQSRMLEAVRLALAKFTCPGHVNEGDFRVTLLRENSFRVLCRFCPLPQVLQACGGDESLVELVLSELFTALYRPLSWYWSCADDPGSDSEQKQLHRSVLLNVAKQLPQMYNHGADQELNFVTKWIHTGGDSRGTYDDRRNMERRFVLVGILFNSGKLVASVLFKALESGFAAIDRGDVLCFDEHLITSALRALIELKCLDVLERKLAAEVLCRVRDSRFAPEQRHCHGAYVGTLGVLTAPGDMLADEITGEILMVAKYWLPGDGTESIIWESLWALNQILKAHSGFEQQLAAQCVELAQKVCEDERYKQWGEDNVCTCDAASALREA